MKDTLRVIRQLKTRDLEFFHIRKGYNGKTVCHMLLLDYRRPSTLQDFPFLIGIEDEEEFGRANFIKAIVISEKELAEEDKEEVSIIASGFLDNKLDCHWLMEFEQATIDPRKVGLGENIISAIAPFLIKHNFPFAQEEIPVEKYNLLSQD